MKFNLEPGKYVVAVSGGVDSMVLLNMLASDKNLELVVAHFDHGIRSDSAEDAEFVRQAAVKLGLKFVSEREELGSEASEALARTRRYEFLHKVRGETKSLAIVTAHHQDDLIETALLNTIRGTKRRGLVSLKSTGDIKRPLLNLTKEEIKTYAAEHNLKWREDSTNTDTRYKRNQIRAELAKTLTPEKRKKAVELLKQIEGQDKEIEQLVSDYLKVLPETELPKQEILELSTEEAREIVAGWLRRNGVSFDAQAIGRIVSGAKSLKNGSQIDVQQNYYCLLTKDTIILKRR